MTPAALLLGAVTLSRLAELVYARRNTRLLLAQGAIEVSPAHYPFIVALHTVWLSSLWISGWDNAIAPFWLTVFLGLQVLRIWVLATLGSRWTTRIVILPGAPLIASGPYRFIPHPNYAVVCAEIAVLPLCLGLPWHALVLSAANALVLSVRIGAENEALKSADMRANGATSSRNMEPQA
jgi:methyltransferase